MKKATSKRGYLSQLAQPLLPGEPVLKARHSASLAETEGAGVPVIEDRFEVAQRSARRTGPASHAAEAAISNPFSLSLSLSPSNTPEPSVVAENQQKTLPVTSPVSSELADVSRSAATSDSSQAREQVGDPPRPKPAEDKNVSELHGPSITVSDRTSEVASAHRQGMCELASDGLPLSFAAEKQSRIATDVVDGNASAITKSARSGKDHTSDPGDGKRSPANQADAVKRSEGHRVHIGTVEIRAVLPQSPAPPAPRPMPEPTASRGRSAQTNRWGAALPGATDSFRDDKPWHGALRISRT